MVDEKIFSEVLYVIKENTTLSQSECEDVAIKVIEIFNHRLTELEKEIYNLAEAIEMAIKNN